MAPPLTFVFSGFKPNSFETAIACEANAWFTSNKSIFSFVKLFFFNKAWMAGTGPIPNDNKYLNYESNN